MPCKTTTQGSTLKIRKRQKIQNIPLYKETYESLKNIIRSRCGLHIRLDNVEMVKLRLQKRLFALGMTSYEQYNRYLKYKFIFDEEKEYLINTLSTNYTKFFRHKNVYKMLRQYVLSGFVNSKVKSKIRGLSLGCSTGEEAYCIALVLNEFLEDHHNFSFSILGTDISELNIDTARKGIYKEIQIKNIPISILRKNFDRIIEKKRKFYKIKPEVRKKVKFKKFNIAEDDFSSLALFDFAFCLNVLYYFNKEIKKQILQNIIQLIKPGGYLFTEQLDASCGDKSLIKIDYMLYKKQYKPYNT